MLFGSIEYLNLLPFRVFLKKHYKRNSILHYRKGVPSELNRAFGQRRIDAAFISSIRAKRCRCGELGIVAKGEVISVFALPGKYRKDRESETSNALARVLGIEGEVLIGDKALQRYLNKPEEKRIDLALAWQEQTGLPFVFARLCYNRGYDKRLERTFAQAKTRIPRYILKKEAKKRGVRPKDILWYLEHISYGIGPMEKRALKRFYKLTPNLF